MPAVKILVTGSSGQLGNEIKTLAHQFPSIAFDFTDRLQLPMETADFNAYLSGKGFTHCINCAAYTAVDKAEEESETAFLLNSTSVKELAIACSASNVTLIHISTDYVFDGEANQPYHEIDKTDPVNLYGASKLEGEKLALQHNENTIVIRTSWLYSSYGKNFVKTMIRLMGERESIGVVADQVGCPTYAKDLAKAILDIVMSGPHQTPGIYHYSNEGVISWFQFATAIKEIIKSTCEVKPIHTSEYPTPAKRPSYSAFNTTKIQQEFAITIPNWRESLEKCIALMQV